MLAVNAGVVNCGPVNIGVPPVAALYQLNVTPGCVDVAFSVADEPEQVCTGVCETDGTSVAVVTLAVTIVRVGLLQEPASVAST